MRKKISIASVAFVIAFLVSLLALSSIALATGYGGVSGTVHNVGSDVCGSCHIPHQAKGAYLWAKDPKGTSSGIKPLCYSCHDGIVADTGQYVFDSSKYSHDVTTTGVDCSTCHNPHDNTNTKFLTLANHSSNLCSTCHGAASGEHQIGAHSHPVDESMTQRLSKPIFTVNTTDWVTVTAGTRLYNSTTDQVVAAGAQGLVKCKSCHTPHGAVNANLNTMANTGSALCTNCHE
jgi:predicted CXXCH cytochrome family protein